MFSKTTLTVIVKLLLIVLTFGTVWFLLNRPAVAHQAQDRQRLIPVHVHQLPASFEDRVLLRCDDATLSTAAEIRDLSCVLTNNSSKYIVAGTLNISVLLDNKGTIAQQQSLLTFDTFLHPDFRTEHPNNLIRPGTEYRLQDSSSTFDEPILSIVAFIDYIQFSDGTTVGPDNGGSYVVNAQREGARKYKDWLAAKYRKALSVNTILPLLLQDDDLPPELAITDPNEEQGARIFRRQERRLYETKGVEGLRKHLTQAPK